jgi:SAM-dependent methyltransferase
MTYTEPSTFYDQHPFDWAVTDRETDIRSVVSPLLAELIERLDVNSLILDVGCGPGRVLGFLARGGFRCIGIDRSRVSIARAVDRYGRPGVVADNLRLPIADSIVDAVISDGVIHHTESPYAALAENLRILKPGGQLYLGVYKPFGRYRFLYAFPGAQIRSGLLRPWTTPIVILFAQMPYFLFHFIKSGGSRTWSQAQNLFYDYFVTPIVTFLPRSQIETWCVSQGARVMLYDENGSSNVHSFVLLKNTLADAEIRDKKPLEQVSYPSGAPRVPMNDNQVIRSAPAILGSRQEIAKEANLDPTRLTRTGHPVYSILWNSLHVLLLASILFVIYAATWEYSTRTYLKGFSDAVIPAAATPQEKIGAILNWMSHGPARRVDPIGVTENRDPTDTLNYQALLQVCGSATNAFINLADSSGLSSRRLLLLDSSRGAKHVVAEVNLDGQWIVVDPSFRTILRGANGQLLTRLDLANPDVFSIATRNIPNYDPSYNYAETEHVRVERIPFFGQLMRKALNFFLPAWQDSRYMSLLLERESFAAVITSLLMLLLLVLARFSLRWFGESRLGIRTIHVRERVRRAAHALMASTS